MMSAKIRSDHLRRAALVYVRQSSIGQVQDHPESRRRQYALVTRAQDLGFRDVEVVDEDLGRSGAGFSDRPGFRRLLAAVGSGRVGAVLALEASRLARNDRDWAHLVELGSFLDVVLIDHDDVYDPRLLNDRLLLGLKGIMSEFELATLRQRAQEAVRAKAARGELYLHAPIGLVYAPSGKLELDPDVRVQQAIRLVFEKFRELGSIRQVMLWLRREGVSVPRIRRPRRLERLVEWDAPSYHQVHAILTNPFYAGAYAYGRTETRTAVIDGRVRKTSGHVKAIEEWEVLLLDHHPGYIEWERYLQNAKMVDENAYAKPSAGRKSARGGRSLLSGLLRCRRCGHMLQVSYPGRDASVPAFRCTRRHHTAGDDFCITFGGKRVEQAVANELLRAVEDKAVDAAFEAARRAGEKHAGQRKALELELEQARYDAQLAARRYERVDPDQRLVAAELEARWNVALEHVAELEKRIASFDQRREASIDVDRKQLLGLASDLAAVWNDSATDMRLKQRIVRLLLHEIIADVDDQTNQVLLVLHWQGGRHSELRVEKNASGRTDRCTPTDAIALAKQMAGRWDDRAIATALNRIGARTGTGKRWNADRVRALRRRLDLPEFDPTEPTSMGLTCQEAAARLGLSPQYLGELLARGEIPGTQVARGAPWLIDAAVIESKEVRATLDRLSRRSPRSQPSDDRNLKIPGT
jgi:excisionase family DNA binding protein